MKILLINPEKLIAPPFGLLYIGTVLKDKGHDVRLFEMPYGTTAIERSELLRSEIEAHRPDVIGITCMSMQAAISRDMIKEIKKTFKGMRVIVGGVHPTLDSHDVLLWGADIAVKGEGESTILDIIDYLNNKCSLESIKGISYKKGAEYFDNPERGLIKDLNCIPSLSYGLLGDLRFRKRNYAIRGSWQRNGFIMTARGCPGKCIFCASKTMHGRVVREFKIDRMVEEVAGLKKKYGIEGFWILDDTFSLKERRVIEFCEGLKSKGMKLRWACQARVDTFTEGMAKAMKGSGCVQVDFGVESGSQRMLDYMKKEITCEETKKAFTIARSSGLRVGATVIVGMPTEGRDDIRMTEKLLDEIKPDFVAPFFATPYPGTELYEMAKERGWLDISKDINWQSTDEPLMTVDMPSQEIKKIYDRLMVYTKSVTRDYLVQPQFLFDLTKTILMHPKYIFRMCIYTITGRKKDAMNLFLYIFRKEMLNT